MAERTLKWDRWTFNLDERPLIMGVVNITPDSFSDGGDFLSESDAVSHGFELVEAGADILDIGGESTRPGAEQISEEREMERVVPVIRQLSAKVNVPISIDTYRSEVARAALEAGASIVNDISGGRFDPEILSVAADAGTPLILMHMQGEPRTMQKNPEYTDLMKEVAEFLSDVASRAEAAGVKREMIVLDPGIGFGKTFNHNLVIINRLRELTELGYPLLVGASRKAFLGHILNGAPPKQREWATAAVHVLAAYNGADIIRVHNVEKARETLAVTNAVIKEHA